MFAGAAVFGSRWFARADPFEVYSMTVSRLAPLRRNTATGRIVVGNPLDHLPTLPVRPGTVAVMAMLLGSTAFDSFSGFTGFRNFVDRNAAGVPLVGEAGGGSAIRTVGLLVFVAVVGVTFSAAARATGGVTREQRRELPGRLAHCLIPIVVGYIFAHYLSYLIERGQETVVRLADPPRCRLATVWTGLRRRGLCPVAEPDAAVDHQGRLRGGRPRRGVLAAHDQALRVIPVGHQLTGQLAMMLVMVAYT